MQKGRHGIPIALGGKVAVVTLALALSADTAAAEDVQLVKFLCNTPQAVQDVIGRSDDLVVGVSGLPSGCRWLPPGTFGDVVATVRYVDTPGGGTARVAAVEVNRRRGFSAGLVELVS